MTANISSKAIALAGISVLIAGSIAVVTTIAQGYLFEIKKAMAEMEKARGAIEMARASNLDAVNKLKGTENAAGAVITAAKLDAGAIMAAAYRTAAATENASKQQADGLYRATEESVAAENGVFRSFTQPIFLDPAKRIAALNLKTAVRHCFPRG